MSFVKISDLTEKTTLAGTEEVLINDSGTSKKMATQRFLDVQTAAEAAQTAAELAETNAETAETNAAASASAASTSATNASNSASAASTSASNASASATAASNAQSAAETARDQTLTAFDSFDDRYLGTKASDPALDNDGNALVAGALYFNSTDGAMKVYDGSQWLAAYASLSGALIATNNLSDLNDAATARTNLGLGSAATTASTDYATAAQGSTADSALQNLIEDTTPQLGGTLDANGNSIDMGTYTITDAGVGQWNSTTLTVGTKESNWDAAYGWGNHASAGYLTVITGQSIENLSDVNTMTPSDGQLLTWDNTNSRWDAADAPVSLPDQTGNSGKYLTSNGTVASWDALATVANSGAYSDLSGTPTNVSTFTNDSGYITGNQTITLSGDVTGSGTTSISVTVADDSHNHIISNVDGLQTALDAKQAAATALTTSTTFGGDVSGTYNAIVVADDSHNHIISNVDGLQTALDGKQPLDADLTAIGALAKTDGNFIVGNGTTWVAESGATARTSLGLGGLATLSSVNAATITDNSVGAAELNVSGNGTSGQALLSDGDGTFSWGNVGGGKVLQVVQTVKTDTFVTSASATDVSVTGLSVSITPSSTSSKILIFCNLSVSAENAQGAAAKLKRGSTSIFLAGASGSRSRSSFSGSAYRGAGGGYLEQMRSLNLTALDSPNTTSSTTYSVAVSSISVGTYVNRTGSDANSTDALRSVSYITAMEIGA